jgi:Phytanoyl-CoA dioxygenase (PhyH)
MNAPSPALSDRERRAWRDDGFFVRMAAFAAVEVEALRAAAERVRAAATALAAGGRAYAVDGNRYVDAGAVTVQLEHGRESTALRVVEPFHDLDPTFERLGDDARIVAPMRELVGSDRVALWTDKLNFKPPREGSGFRWHQDSPYWAHACRHLDRLPNVMLALDDADAENGCMRVVRGSHRVGLLPGRSDDGVLGPLFTDPAHIDLGAQVAAAMPAGSLLFFSPHTVHGSEPNRSDRARRALVITYQPAGHDQFKAPGMREAGRRTE